MNSEFKKTQLKAFGVMIESGGVDQDVRELNVDELRALFRTHRLVVLRGFKSFSDAGEFADYCERWGEISLWPFGKVLELVEQPTPEDHIFDNSYVPLHWDGMYRPQIPEYQIFHCVHAPSMGQGGRTTFSNTVTAFESAPAAVKNLWRRATGAYQRKMEYYDSRTVSPIVTEHPRRGFTVMRYNEPPSEDQGRFINPSDLTFTGISDAEQADLHRTLKSALYSPLHFYAHAWQSGDIVIADNFSLLHGREAFASGAPRHLRRVHVLSDPPFDNPGLKAFQQ